MLKRIILLICGILCTVPHLAVAENPDNRSSVTQNDALEVAVTVTGSGASSNVIRPMWSYSQEWGRYTQYEQWEGNVHSKVSYHWQNRKNRFSINAGIALEANTDRSLTTLHEAYVSGRIWKIGYTFGREAYTPINQHGDLGLGTYLMSDNARPVWRAGTGFFDYWAVPGTKNWIEIKGALFLSPMSDEGVPQYTKDFLLHEKFAYLRIGHFPVKPYLGLIHSVMMGGTLSSGETIPIDFWASFFGMGSKKLRDAGFKGEYYNAAGGHQGMWDLGLDLDFDILGGSVYYNLLFYDSTSMNVLKFARNKDFSVGTHLKFKRFKPVREVCVEFMTTCWQGGNGPADPVFISTGPEKTGEVVSLCQKEVSPETLRKYVSAEWIKDWEKRNGTLNRTNCADLMTEVQFYGRGNTPDGEPWSWGNRSPYLENGYYPQGWTVNGLSTGTPVFLTSTSMRAVAPDYSFFRRFSNVRMRAYNVGLCGDIVRNFDYRFKFTVTDNFGSLTEQYYSGIDFDKQRPNYYFGTDKIECYSALWLNYHYKRLTFSLNLAYDFGDIYRCFSGRLGTRLTFDTRLHN